MTEEMYYEAEDFGWYRVPDPNKRIWEKQLGPSIVHVELEDVYKDPTSKLPSLLVKGEWGMVGEDIKIQLTDVSDNRASRGGEIIKKKGRHAINPFTI
jgi:hypothetical protein